MLSLRHVLFLLLEEKKIRQWWIYNKSVGTCGEVKKELRGVGAVRWLLLLYLAARSDDAPVVSVAADYPRLEDVGCDHRAGRDLGV